MRRIVRRILGEAPGNGYNQAAEPRAFVRRLDEAIAAAHPALETLWRLSGQAVVCARLREIARTCLEPAFATIPGLLASLEHDELGIE